MKKYFKKLGLILSILLLLGIPSISNATINLTSNFTENAQLPLDSRTVVASYSDLASIPTIQLYNGLTAYVQSPSGTYQYQGTPGSGTWVQLPYGSGTINEIPIWNSSDVLGGDANFNFDNASEPGSFILYVNGALNVASTLTAGVGTNIALNASVNYTPQLDLSTSIEALQTDVIGNDNGADNNSNYYGASYSVDLSNFLHNIGGQLVGFTYDILSGGAGTTTSTIYGFQGVINATTATSTVTNAIGSEVVFQSILAGGNFTNAIDYHVRDISGNSILGTHYGFKSEPISRGGVNYGIWLGNVSTTGGGEALHVDGGNSEFKGPVLFSGSTSGSVTVSAPATVTSYPVVLPAAQGTSGTTLVNDGSGNLTWTAGSPTLPQHTVDLTVATGTSIASVPVTGKFVPNEAVCYISALTGTIATNPVIEIGTAGNAANFTPVTTLTIPGGNGSFTFQNVTINTGTAYPVFGGGSAIVMTVVTPATFVTTGTLTLSCTMSSYILQ